MAVRLSLLHLLALFLLLLSLSQQQHYSCKAILEKSRTVGSGSWAVNFDAENPSALSQLVYCDMHYDGGGWTMIYTNYGGNIDTRAGMTVMENAAMITNYDSMVGANASPYILPTTFSSLSYVSTLYSKIKTMKNLEWLKVMTLYNTTTMKKEFPTQYIKVFFNETTMAELTSLSGCTITNQLPITVNGKKIGSTVGRVENTIENSVASPTGIIKSFGLLTPRRSEECTSATPFTLQEPDLPRVDGLSSWTALETLLFHPLQTNAIEQGSSCAFGCWENYEKLPPLIEVIGWAVREGCDTRDCSCLRTHADTQCQIPICNGFNASSPLVCGGSGVCTGYNNCTCNRESLGTYCQLKCDCNGHGTCVLKPTPLDENARACVCDPGWGGTHCGYRTNTSLSNDVPQAVLKTVQAISIATTVATSALSVPAIVCAVFFKSIAELFMGSFLTLVFYFQTISLLLFNNPQAQSFFEQGGTIDVLNLFTLNLVDLFDPRAAADRIKRVSHWYSAHQYFLLKAIGFGIGICLWYLPDLLLPILIERQARKNAEAESKKSEEQDSSTLEQPNEEEAKEEVSENREPEPTKEEEEEVSKAEETEQKPPAKPLLVRIYPTVKKLLFVVGYKVYYLPFLSAIFYQLFRPTGAYPVAVNVFLCILAAILVIYVVLIKSYQLCRLLLVNKLVDAHEKQQKQANAALAVEETKPKAVNPALKILQVGRAILQYTLFFPLSLGIEKLYDWVIIKFILYVEAKANAGNKFCKWLTKLWPSYQAGQQFKTIYGTICDSYSSINLHYEFDIMLIRKITWTFFQIVLMGAPVAQIVTLMLIQLYFLAFYLVHLPHVDWFRTVLFVVPEILILIQKILLLDLVVRGSWTPMIGVIVIHVLMVVWTVFSMIAPLVRECVRKAVVKVKKSKNAEEPEKQEELNEEKRMSVPKAFQGQQQPTVAEVDEKKEPEEMKIVQPAAEAAPEVKEVQQPVEAPSPQIEESPKSSAETEKLIQEPSSPAEKEPTSPESSTAPLETQQNPEPKPEETQEKEEQISPPAEKTEPAEQVTNTSVHAEQIQNTELVEQ